MSILNKYIRVLIAILLLMLLINEFVIAGCKSSKPINPERAGPQDARTSTGCIPAHPFMRCVPTLLVRRLNLCTELEAKILREVQSILSADDRALLLREFCKLSREASAANLAGLPVEKLNYISEIKNKMDLAVRKLQTERYLLSSRQLVALNSEIIRLKDEVSRGLDSNLSKVNHDHLKQVKSRMKDIEAELKAKEGYALLAVKGMLNLDQQKQLEVLSTQMVTPSKRPFLK